MNEKKLTALISVLAFGLAGMALVPVGMDAGAEHMPLAQANETTEYNPNTEPTEIATSPFPTDTNPQYAEIDLGYGKLYFEIHYDYAVLSFFSPLSYDEGQETVILQIPSEVEGYPVKYISAGSMGYMNFISEVILPETVVFIGDGAFESSESLQRITIPEGVEKIGYSAFRHCKNLKEVILPDTLTSLGDGAFWGTGLESITLPERLSVIPEYAFRDCTALKSIIFPNVPFSISSSAFRNTAFTEITIPNGTSLSSNIFAKCNFLQKVSFGDDITTIPSGTFTDCSALKEISFTNSITSISDAFFCCVSVNQIYFDGSVDEWNIIAVSEHDAEIIANAEIHCNSYANLNGDMSIDAEDSSMILNASALAGSGTDSGLTEQQISDADVNFDGEYNATDAAVILEYAAAFGSGEKVTLADFLNE